MCTRSASASTSAPPVSNESKSEPGCGQQRVPYPSVCLAPWASCRYSGRTGLAARQRSVRSGPWWRPGAPFPQGSMGNLEMRRTRAWSERTPCFQEQVAVVGVPQTVRVAAERGLVVRGRQAEVEVSRQVFHPHGGVIWEHGLAAGQLLLQISHVQLQRKKKASQSGINKQGNEDTVARHHVMAGCSDAQQYCTVLF